MKFRNRSEAGQVLATMLARYAGRSDVLVLGLPRGGVPVAFEVAMALKVPLVLFMVRKLGVPENEELAMGAIASGVIRVLNEDVITSLRIPRVLLEAVSSREMRELERRELAYRGKRQAASISSRSVVLVDDGLATGSTMLAAARAVRSHNPSRTVVAVPVAPPETCGRLRNEADEVVCAVTPAMFAAVGLWYEDFSQTSDEQVRELYESAARRFE
jgi:putative phosphoribosyl transferase